MKFHRISCVLIWSEHFRKLADWYQNVLGLKVIGEINHPNDTGVLFEIAPGEAELWVGQHSDVKGKSKDPCRIMVNLAVDSVGEIYKELQKKGIKIIAPPFKAPTFDKYFVTFCDPDGNLLQVIGGK